MKRWHIYVVSVFALLVAADTLVYAAPAPNNCAMNMLCRVRTLFASGATFSGEIYTQNIIPDGGARLCLNGTGACTVYIASDTLGGVQGAWGAGANWTGNYSSTGDVNLNGYINPQTGIKNTATAAACSGNTGAVCVNDTGGLAVADGAGATVATITAAGAATFANVFLSTGTSLVYAAACDSTGTPGNATCNQGAGRAAIAASSATVTITNSLSKTTSIIHATLQTTDGVCTGIKSLVPSNSSFVITTNAVCTGNTNVAWGFDSP